MAYFDLRCQKCRHSGESRNLFPIPAKAGIYTPKGANCRRRRTNVQLPAALRRLRFLPSREWDGRWEWNWGREVESEGRGNGIFLGYSCTMAVAGA
ncbi:MAG: hypothetical protein ACR2QC_09350 [Gammaproteobacteria bacterium]